jgi:hypothetical protein
MTTFATTLNPRPLFAALTLAAGFTAAVAAPVAPLTPLVAGQPAKASDVNGNFTTIVTTVNANDTRLTNVETSKQNIVTQNCPQGSAIRAIAANGTVTCQNSGGSVGFASVAAMIAFPRTIPGTNVTQTSIGGGLGKSASLPAGVEYIVAPIVLPHGATVTSFSFSCYHNSSASNCDGYLYRSDGNELAFVSISALSTTIQTASTTTITGALVDNQSFGYWVYMLVNGTAGANITPMQASVTYTMP